MAEQVTKDDLHIHGGVVQQVTCMGDVYMHGGVVNTMEVQGDCKQSGGVINRRVQQSVAQTIYQQPEPRVVYKDRIIYRDKPSTDPKIESLQSYNRRLNNQLRWAENKIANLQKEISKQSEHEEPDNVLVDRIEHLKLTLAKEREEHRKKVEELEWRLKAVTDIANGRNERLYEDETNGHYIGVTDDSFDVLFTLINEYPIGNDVDTAEELGLSVSTLRRIAKDLRLAKSPEARREAKERLKRHGIDMIERRGGDQTKEKRQKKTKH